MSAQLSPLPVLKFTDSSGNPLVDGQLFTYQAGTTTPLATYTDASAGTPNANPVILDSNGSCVVWIGSSAYKFVLKDALNNVLWTSDNIQTVPNGSIGTAQLAAGAVTSTIIANGAVGTTQLADGSVTTVKIAANAVTAAKIPNGSLANSKLVAVTEALYADTSDGKFGGGPRGFRRIPWSAPTLIANPNILASSNGNGIAWSPNSAMLAFAESSSAFNSLFSRSSNLLTKLSALEVAPAHAATGLAWSPNGEYLGFSLASSPYFVIYQRSGFNWSQLSVVGLCGGIPAGAGNAIAWSPNGNFVAIAHATTPYVRVLQRSFIYPTAAQVRYTSSNGQTVASTTGTAITWENVSQDNAGAVSQGPWTFTAQRANGYKVTACITFAAAAAWAINKHVQIQLIHNGTLYSYLENWQAGGSVTGAVIAKGSDWVYMYPGDTLTLNVIQNSGSTLGLATDVTQNYISIIEDPGFTELPSFSKISNPVTLPAGTGQAVAWSPNSEFLAVGHQTSPFVSVYSLAGTVLTKIADSITLPPAAVTGLAWSPDGQYLVCTSATTPYLQIYQLVIGVGITLVPVANPLTLPAGAASGAAWAPSGDLLAIAHTTSPYITIYSWDGSTFTKLADPSALPPGNATGVSWSIDGRFLAVSHANSPYMTVYQTSGSLSNNGVLYLREDFLV